MVANDLPLLSDSPSLDPKYPSNATIVEGGNLTPQCRVTAANPEPNITWYRFTANNTALSYRANLTFVNASRGDAGKYYCVAGNGIGKAVTSAISTVDVQCELLTVPYSNCENLIGSIVIDRLLIVTDHVCSVFGEQNFFCFLCKYVFY